MTPKQRLMQLAERVKEAGLSGGSMQDKLAEIIQQNDLTQHEIQRIAEMANRDVQLGLYKTAHDKRFKFKLIDPAPLKEAAKRAAAASSQPTSRQIGQSKTAMVIDQSGGDPFRVPYRAPTKLSLYDHPMDEKLAHELESAEVRKTILQLDKAKRDTEQLFKQGQAEIIKVAEKADQSYKQMIQAALDMVQTGVTLPSLYQAVMVACSGRRLAQEEIRKNGEDLMMLIILGLKKRGVPNHRMGFRHRGDPATLDKLSPDDLLKLCQLSTGQIKEHDVDMRLTKIANYDEHTVKATGPVPSQRMDEEAAEFLNKRTSVKQYPVAQTYLDDRNVDNLPGGKPKVLNTNNEFIIAVTDLMGDQSRMVRLHSANEYIGLKLKQIEQAMRKLDGAQKTADAEFQKKQGGIGDILGSQKTTNVIGAAGLGIGALPFLKKTKDMEAQEEAEHRRKIGLGSFEKTAIPGLGAVASRVGSQIMKGVGSQAFGNAANAAGVGLTAASMMGSKKETAAQGAPAAQGASGGMV